MNEINNKIEMNTNERNIGAVDNIIRITNPDHNLESHNYVALNNNNIDIETRKATFDANNLNHQTNLFTYLNLNHEQIEKFNIKIFANGKRIMLKNAYILWITYFLIISVSLLYFIFV